MQKQKEMAFEMYRILKDTNKSLSIGEMYKILTDKPTSSLGGRGYKVLKEYLDLFTELEQIQINAIQKYQIKQSNSNVFEKISQKFKMQPLDLINIMYFVRDFKNLTHKQFMKTNELTREEFESFTKDIKNNSDEICRILNLQGKFDTDGTKIFYND